MFLHVTIFTTTIRVSFTRPRGHYYVTVLIGSHVTCEALSDGVSDEHRSIPVVTAVSDGFVERSRVQIDGIV